MANMLIRPVEGEGDWARAAAIRQRVFVEEQACPPEEEWDEHDAGSRHLLGHVHGAPAATARWRAFSFEHRPAAKLERFAVLPEHRGRGFGRALVAFVIADAEAAGFPVQVVHAQAHLEPFYASFGFETTGERFEEAGIPHVKMVRRRGE